MLTSHPNYRGKTIIVVEGNTDIRLFRSIFENDIVRIEALSGKKDLVDAICKLLDEGVNNLLGICDADFDNIKNLGEKYIKNNIFLTDSHDAEMMILCSPALNAFICEFGSIENHDLLMNNLLNKVIETAYKIGILKWINFEEDFNLNFRGLHFEEFVEINNLNINIDTERYIDIVYNRSKKAHFYTSKNHLIKIYDEYMRKGEDALQICSGHDITKIISILFRNPWSSIDLNLNQSKIESALRIAYSFDFFKQTKLYFYLLTFSKENCVPLFS